MFLNDSNPTHKSKFNIAPHIMRKPRFLLSSATKSQTSMMLKQPMTMGPAWQSESPILTSLESLEWLSGTMVSSGE